MTTRRSFFAAIAGLFCLPWWKPTRKFFDIPEGYGSLTISLQGWFMHSLDGERAIVCRKQPKQPTINLSQPPNLSDPYPYQDGLKCVKRSWQVRYENQTPYIWFTAWYEKVA